MQNRAEKSPEERARRDARRITVAGLGGILLVAAGVGLTLLPVGGLVLPTVLAILGVGSLLAAVVSGAVQIGNAYRRSDSDFDR
jgi:hypothetical protein